MKTPSAFAVRNKTETKVGSRYSYVRLDPAKLAKALVNLELALVLKIPTTPI